MKREEKGEERKEQVRNRGENGKSGEREMEGKIKVRKRKNKGKKRKRERELWGRMRKMEDRENRQ